MRAIGAAQTKDNAPPGVPSLREARVFVRIRIEDRRCDLSGVSLFSGPTGFLFFQERKWVGSPEEDKPTRDAEGGVPYNEDRDHPVGAIHESPGEPGDGL